MIKGSDWGGSRLTSAQTCKQKYFYSYEAEFLEGGQGLIAIEDKLAPTRGTIIHAGLQRLYDNKLHKPEMSFGDCMVDAIHHAVEQIKNYKLDPNVVPLLTDEIISCLDQYGQKYEVNDLIPTGTEIPIHLPVGDLVHTGIVDLQGTWSGHDVVVDHKTTSMQLPFLFKKLRFNLSLMGYAKKRSEELGHIVSVLINGIKFKNNKALECEFDRDIITYTQKDFDDFDRTVVAIRREIDACKADGFWPKSGDQCVQIWGECEFRKLCMFPDQAMVKTFYRSRT